MGSAERCAAHPDLAAVAVCERCGDFCCRACQDGRRPGLCVRCAARLPSGLPWEDRRAGRWPRRFAASAWLLLRRPERAFPGPARVGPSLGFAALVGALIASAALGLWGVLMTDASARPDALLQQPPGVLLGGLVGLAAGLVIAPVAWSFVTALSFGAGLQLVGRRVGTFKIAVRSCAYAQVVTLACIALPFAPALAKAVVPAPELDSAVHAAWVLATFLWPLGTARVAYAAGRGLGLVSGKALAAAAFPMLTCVPAAVYMSEQQLELLGL